MKNLNKTILLLLPLLFFMCSKNDVVRLPTGTYSDKVVLQPLKANKDSVTITWSELVNDKFAYYEISRKLSKDGVADQVIQLPSAKETTFIDSYIPYTPYICYQVTAVLQDGSRILSNIEEASLPEIRLTLENITTQGTAIVLKWNKVDHPFLVSYKIMRIKEQGQYGMNIATLNATATNYVDTTYPYSNYLAYKVVANMRNGFVMESNLQNFEGTTRPAITLYPIEHTSDGIKLRWSSLRNSQFKQYVITRKISADDPGEHVFYTTNRTDTVVTDKFVPYIANVIYQVVGTTTDFYHETVLSNTQTYQRPEIVSLIVDPFDIQYDPESKLVYFFEKTGKITVFNTTSNTITGTINAGIDIGYCSLGKYNGVKELYIAGNGWIDIYNTTTLQKVDRINVAGVVTSALFNNNFLFSYVNAPNPLKVYNRQNKALVSETGGIPTRRIKLIPGTNTNIFAVPNTGYNYIGYYQSDELGTIKNHNEVFKPINLPNPNIFEVFPGEEKFISTSSGIIYNKSLSIENVLPRGNLEFQTFSFNTSGTEIYAGSNMRSIEVYRNNTFEWLRSFKSNITPIKIFVDTDKIINIGLSQPFLTPKRLTIEYLNN